ncbi:GNAT family N-acetyltransferase [Streptomyces lancefieldiae]|uniref:GNAT family N-acetyltransferase n=1 Tax=Streptomyces lancefieldiae TaxID=3075520 RepID=A0ABU3AV99_9ACTN|nr:GNAT family N-acetyltransferase [Streptomyces sp. DSM 40712]MDT0614123.1 GNAT family N-acetyltransferase [Streptomyces sp. DSM 40712]
MDTRIRLLQDEDWDDVVALEALAYAASGLSEGREALRSRHRVSPSTCFVLEHAGAFGGYLLALPYPLFRCPDLSLSEESAARPGDREGNLHIHDLVIAERVRGRGMAPRMQRHLEEVGRRARHRSLSLVAVHGSRPLWARLGYRTRPEVALPASYGAEAVYMTKSLEPAAAPPASAPGARARS